MSNQEWAAIVYGRSYHLDFRFITVPHNFTEQDIQWASTYIIATTQKARNLAGYPRWSLFKNEFFCIMGVTCMVRDLIDRPGNDLPEIMTKDDQGRPLYVFVGYVTQLSSPQLNNFPPYTETCLDNFQNLYQEIEKIWSLKNYELDSRHPVLSQYQALTFGDSAFARQDDQIPQLNDRSKYPDKTYLWSSLKRHNSLLWSTSARCSQPTSICLNIKGKTLVNSPFLNQSSNQIEQFQITARIASLNKLNPLDTDERPPEGFVSCSLRETPKTALTHRAAERRKTKGLPACTREFDDDQPNLSLPQKISNRAKADIDLTLQQATKLATAGQDLIDSFSDWSDGDQSESDLDSQTDSPLSEPDFGFKPKKSSSKQDWF